MRQRWAMGLALATGALVLILAVVFALILNRPDGESPPVADRPPEAGSPPAPALEQVARGQEVFVRSDCTGCHSVAGKGSPRSPLDGVGSRLARHQLRDWVVASESVRGQLPARAIQAKQRYAGMPPEDMDALLSYLGSLRQ